MVNINKKIISLILCFALFFSFEGLAYAITEEDVTSAIEKVGNTVLFGVTDWLVKMGDGALHLISASVGETITIDKLIFNDVQKVSIDYWNDVSGDNVESANQQPIKAFMEPVVDKWYKVFHAIAIVVYLIVLVYIGIAILLSSTAEKKAGYKELFTSWFMGIAILFLFPYIMKYIITVNNAVVDILSAKAQSESYVERQNESNLADKNFFEMSFLYGTDGFVKELSGIPQEEDIKEENLTDVMVLTRYAAQHGTDMNKISAGNIGLAIAYLIVVGQTIAILIMYYKRAFMIAFLITIFPLVAMTYVIDKMGDGKNQSFGTWFKEFTVNVIVQMFHAVVYILICGVGVKLYIENGGRNFIFMILSVLFLFEGEKILRSIFGIKSSAGSIADLATSGALMWGVATKAGNILKRDKNEIGNSEDKADNKAAEQRIAKRNSRQKENNKAAMEALNEKKESGGSTASHGEYQGEKREPEGVSEDRFDVENAKDTQLMKSMKRRLKGGIATRGVKLAAGVTGATLLTTRAMADGSKPGDVLGSIAAGKELGKTLATPITMGTSKLEQMHWGRKAEKEILNGSRDEELGIDKIDNTMNIPTGMQVKNEETGEWEDKFTSKQEIYREALAKYSKVAARGGKAKGEIAFYNYIEKNLRNEEKE